MRANLLVGFAVLVWGQTLPPRAIEFVQIPAGEFVMGCAPTDSPYASDGTYAPCNDDEKPAHRARITKPFEMGKYEDPPSRAKAAERVGLYDILGNVAEWVQDWLGETYYKSSPQDDPQGAGSGTYHMARGGSWYSTAGYLRASRRYPCACAGRRDTGFRCAREPVR